MWPFSSPKAPEQDSHQALQQGPPPVPQDRLTETLDDDKKGWWARFDINAVTDHPGERLGIPAVYRITFLTAASILPGLAIGSARGGSVAADRYRAENAHRFPSTTSGWYLYHRTKSYHHVLGSVKGGVSSGMMLGVWGLLFGVTEEVIDRSRERIISGRDQEDGRLPTQRDVASSVMAALAVSGLYSWTQGFDHFAAGRMARMSLKFSLAYGLAQDTLAALRGVPPAYISWIKKNTFWPSKADDAIV